MLAVFYSSIKLFIMSLLGLQIIKDKELPILAKAINDDLQNKEATLLTINCIDDLLNLQRIEGVLNIGSLTKNGFLRKTTKRNLSEFLTDRIDLFINDLQNLSMKNIEIFFGNTENQKQTITNLFHKFFPDNSIEFRTANENPFTDEITHYGSIKISEEQEDKFQSFFSEYKRFI